MFGILAPSLAVSCTLAFIAPSAADVVITEIMYHPASDLDGDEFLELHNTGATTVNLENWQIDGIGFVFGLGASIEPGAYVVLAADAVQFEATYGFAPDHVYDGRLSNAGESLKLLDGGAALMDEVAYDDKAPWPVTPDGLGPSLELIDPAEENNTPRNWHASTNPAGNTAGLVNSVNTTGLPPWISNVQHTVEPQPNDPVTVTATVEDASTVGLTYVIDFGTNATGPMLDDGLHGDGAAGDGVYGAVIPGQAARAIVRYRISVLGPTGGMDYPRDDDTVNYAGTMVADPSLTSNVPIFHWCIDPVDYQHALDHYLTDETEPAVLYCGGVLYDNISIRVRGQTARLWPKKHWKFFFPQGHEFFDAELTDIPVDQFNLQSNYSDKSYVRELLAYETFRDAGHPYCHASPVRLQKNGQFFGLYTCLEGMDLDYLERHGIDKNGAWYKAFDDMRARPLVELPDYYERKTRRTDDYTDLFNLLDNINNLTGQALSDFLFDNIDIPGMLNYLAANCVIHNNDHPAKNYFLYRDTEGTGRWVMHAWDMDLTFGRNLGAGGGVLSDGIWADNDTITGRPDVSPSHPLFGDSEHQKYEYLWNRLIDVLYAEPDIREMYFRRLRTLIDGSLVAGRYEARIAELIPLIEDEVEPDRQAWGWYGETQTLTEAIALITDDYLPRRRNHLFVTHRVVDEIPEAQSASPSIIINEIMYHPVGVTDDEFVELYNPSPTESVDLSGWRLDGVALSFPVGAVLLPGAYLLVVEDDVQFRTTYGSGHLIVAQYQGKLDNGGETLTLTDREGNVIDEMCYDDDAPWPVSADGSGPSLELIDPSQDNNRPANWAASAATGGTPGAPNSTTGTTQSVPDLWVNEVLPVNASINTNGQGEFDPWIEIYNASTDPIDLSGMLLTDDYLIPTNGWPIPSGTTLDGESWLLIWADAEPGGGPLHASFALSATGGSVGLYTTTYDIIDYLNYDVLPADVSYGKFPDGIIVLREFVVPTPGAANYIEPVGAILNEYNAVSSNGFLKNDGTDTFWGRIEGNGGDWFELVVTQDHLDMRGWQLVVSDDTGGAGQTVQMLDLTTNGIWADLRSGTIITVSEDLPDDVGYDPLSGDWWINVQANDGAPGTYITAANFSVSNTSWQLTIRDNLGADVFGPAGEGIKPTSGIGSDEVFKLEEDPGPFINERSNYNDGTSSTFGSPNIFAAGTMVQDFSELRDVVCALADNGRSCDDGNACTGNDVCSNGVCVGTAVDCDDNNPCTDDSCDPESGCQNVPNDLNTCSDGAACTDDTCTNGACVSVDSCPLGQVCDTGMGQCIAEPLFAAYNDVVYDPALHGTATDPNGQSVHYIAPNVTTFGIGAGFGGLTSGELLDHANGDATGVTVTLTQAGGVYWQPMVGHPWAGGYDAALGTDARNTFRDIADMTGTVYYGSAGWWVNVAFTGLNPQMRYTFVTSASRASKTTDGPPGYVDRYTIYTISGVDAAANASTPGTEEYLGDPLSVTFNTGNNHDEGYVARWTDIEPGADGSFAVRAEANPTTGDGMKAYSFDVFGLQGFLECTTNGDCDDGLFCSGAETCDTNGVCQLGVDPCPGQLCREFDHLCVDCMTNGHCDDGMFCNGAETCDTNGVCQPGADPCPGQNCKEALDECGDCQTNGDCDDGVFCNGAETCDTNGVCQPGVEPCVDLAHCDEQADICLDCLNHSECTDGLFCNGVETCGTNSFCQPGEDPCPGQVCNEANDTCNIERVYDFTTNGGLDRFAFGTYTNSWLDDLEGIRRQCPEVCTEVTAITPDAYDRLAFSDSTGGDADPNRYINPDPAGQQDESTLVVEFNILENPPDVLQIDVTWEGYGDNSHHIELYIWDYVQGNWGNGAGLYGEDNFMADGSGSTDFVLSALVTTNASNYVSPTGEVSLLIYDDERTEDSFHDYVSIGVTAPVVECYLDTDCDDFNPCTDDTCVDRSCVFTPDTANSCEDDLFCNGVETCDTNGVCQPGTPDVCDDSVGCTMDSCDEVNDVCVNTASNGLCDNGDYCDGAETCDPLLDCQAGTPVDCTDGVGCTVDSCDEVNDTCVNAPSNGLCDNGEFCDGVEVCDPLLDCQAGTPVDCTDWVGCTVDLCDEVNDTCVNVASNGLCDNGDYCDGVEICDPLFDCLAGTPVDCDDGVGCTVDSCDEANDTCVNAVSNGLCDNGEFCDGVEVCDPLLDCQAGTPIDCHDGVGCTFDLCNEVDDACLNVPNNGLCDNGVFCDGAEICDPLLDCQAGTDPCGAGEWCDEDGDACVPYGNGDFNSDGDVDLADFAAFQSCFGQLGLGACEPGNMTEDGTIDLADFALFLAGMGGPW